MDKPLLRRQEFDAITAGWGSDSAEDLEARILLTNEFQEMGTGFTSAETKIMRAMTNRLEALKEKVS